MLPFSLEEISEEDKKVMNLMHAIEIGEMSVLPTLIMKICSDDQNRQHIGPNEGTFNPTPSSESLLAKKKVNRIKTINKKQGCVLM